MHSTTCSFHATEKYSHGEHDIRCHREVYKDGLCIFHLSKKDDPTVSPGEQQKLSSDFLAALEAEVEEAQQIPGEKSLDWRGADFPELKLNNLVFPVTVFIALSTFRGNLNLENCQFNGGLDAAKINCLGKDNNLTVRNCTFLEGVDFRDASLGSGATITNCTFEKKVNLGCKLDSANLSENHFRHDAIFSMATFSRKCDFKFCTFSGDTDFSSLSNCSDVFFDFRLTIISGSFIFGAGEYQQGNLSCKKVNFESSEVLEKSALTFQRISIEIGDFDKLKIGKNSSLVFYEIDFKKVDFKDLRLLKESSLSFDKVKADEADFAGAEIGEDVNLIFDGDITINEMNFSNAQLKKRSSVTFSHPNINRLSFNGAHLNEGVNLKFDGAVLQEGDFCNVIQEGNTSVHFRNMVLSNAKFLNMNVERFHFTDVTWFRIDGRSALKTEDDLKKKVGLLTNQKKLDVDDIDKLLHEVELNSENYRQLVKNQESRRNFSLAEHFHVGEMEMQRLRGVIEGGGFQGVRRVLTSWNDYSLYNILSRYGTSYLRGFLLLGCMVLLMSSLFLLSGLKNNNCEKKEHIQEDSCLIIEYSLAPYSPEKWVGINRWFNDYISAVAYTLSVATLQKDTHYSTAGLSGDFVRVITILLLPGQAALILLAIRRRFKRGSGE